MLQVVAVEAQLYHYCFWCFMLAVASGDWNVVNVLAINRIAVELMKLEQKIRNYFHNLCAQAYVQLQKATPKHAKHLLALQHKTTVSNALALQRFVYNNCDAHYTL